MVKVYFETSSYCHQVAIFDDEETYAACTPALEDLMKKHGFEFMSESVEEARIGKPEDLLTDGELFAELERRGYAVKELWGKRDVQNIYDVSDEVALDIMNRTLQSDWVREQVSQTIEVVADVLGYQCKD